MTRRLAVLLCWLGISNGLSADTKARKELYVPMDYSTCGYHASERALPDVAEAVRVTWHEGDCSATIQQAIDRVSQLKPNRQGHRGAVVMGEGVFRLDRPLRISASGVVLRGMGSGKTVLVKHGVARGALVYMEGSGIDATGSATTDTLYVDADKVMAGSTALPVQHPAGGKGRATALKPGDRIDIVRPCTKEWILSLAMNDFGGGLDYTGWKPTDIDISWDRTITAIHGDTIVVDAPVTTTISSAFGGAYIVRHRRGGELTECGVEHITLASAVNDWNPKDEDHCWDGIFMEHARDCWVRHVSFRRFAGSAVSLQKETSRITVEDCISSEPVSEIGGWRRQTFLTRGQQTLFQRCISRHGIHDFAAGFCAAGPNAFVQCEGEESLGFSGSIGSWAAGLLFDIVNIDGNDIRFANLEQFQFGTGWNTANAMLWQCTASTIECYSPDPDNRSSAHGCWGTLTGNGEWTSSNDHVSPRSLFYDQLERRLAGRPELGANAVDPRILPRSTNATSSPTVEQAMALAQESLNEPRLTMERWIEEVDSGLWIEKVDSGLWIVDREMSYTAPAVTSAEDNSLSTIHYPQSTIHIPQSTFHNSLSTIHNPQSTIHNPQSTFLPGNQYNIPWWSGRVKDNYVKKEGRPAITRFVPGREGTGWTDRIDSVVAYLAAGHYSSLSHHYGLWYDLRRTDHERVRRADGDVWAPFYEQPFARSGQGTAWDGLSRYDLTRPNQWYWSRLREFADKAAPHGITLFHHHYFQHNILEAGAHWVDCPWRPVNNVNMPADRAPFPEPVPFAGDKRIFMAEQFYDETNATLRPLHRQYIRMCLDELKDQPNVVHLISAEYTGPLHFTRFWLQTIAEWEAETGRHATVALSCTKDAQDSVLADPVLSKVVDIIDIRYWHYNTKGLWAPEAGRNMAPRQWMRKMQVGKTGFDEAYRAVREYRERYPDKAVTFFAQQYPDYGWAVFMAGGSLANVPIANEGVGARLLANAAKMRPADGQGCLTLGDEKTGCVVYCRADKVSANVAAGRYDVYTVDTKTGAIRLLQKGARIDGVFIPAEGGDGRVYYLEVKSEE